MKFDTTQFDLSSNNINELYTLLRKHFDLSILFLTAAEPDWDSQSITYNTNNDVAETVYTMNHLTIKKVLTYTDTLLSTQKMYIKGVEESPDDFLFVMGKSYEYDANDNIQTITKLES